MSVAAPLKNIIATGLLIGASTAAVAAPSPTGTFFDFNVGMANYDYSLDGLSMSSKPMGKLAIGWRHCGIGFEVGYAHFMEYAIDGPNTASQLDDIDNVATNALLLGFNVKINLSRDWYAGAHGGVSSWKTSADYHYFAGGKTQTASLDADGTGWYAGIELGKNLTRTFSVGIGVDRYAMNGGLETGGRVADVATTAVSLNLEKLF